MEQVLLSLKEVCEYTGLGKTKVRELLRKADSNYTIRIGNRLYVNKRLFDEYLDRCTTNNIKI